ncbi:WD-40 repeat domain protein [Desulfosarcina variabilis str. Montpellier]|uniref:caspase family protein n=1 Tax=Desulfosarcina variabilis TaxID=2300 RepID=UPI003AFA4139
MKFFLVLLLNSALILGCANSTPKKFSIASSGKDHSVNNIAIGYTDQKLLKDGYYVLIEKSDENYYVKKISDQPIKKRLNERQEILFFNKTLDYMQPYFEKIEYYNKEVGTFECTPFLDDSSAESDYTPCNSDLMTANIGMSLGKNIVAAITTFGVASGAHKAVDQEKLAEILEKSDILDRVNKHKSVAEQGRPSIQFVNTRRTVGGDTARIHLRIKDNGLGIGQVRIFINGSEIYTKDRSLMFVKSPKIDIKSYDIKVQSGLNHITAYVYDHSNTIRSEKAYLEIVGDYELNRKPALHAVVAGIDYYKNKTFDLTCAEADANIFGTTIYKHSKKIFSKVNVYYLRKAQGTTKQAILNQLEQLKDISPNDFFIFYCASHGAIKDDIFYLISSDVNSMSNQSLKSNAISQAELLELFKRIPTSNKLLLFDACYSGGINTKISKALFELSARKLNITSISAAQSQQTALEGYADGHGVFTYVLSDALEGKADFNGDGVVQSMELVSYAKRYVPIAAQEFNHVQYPAAFQGGQVFPITVHANSDGKASIAPQYFDNRQVEQLTTSIAAGDIASYNKIIKQNKTETKQAIERIKKEAVQSDATIVENEFKGTQQQFAIDRIKFIFHDDSVFLGITDKVKDHYTFTDPNGHKLLVVDAYSDQFTKHSVNYINTSKISKIDVGWHNTFYRVTLHLKEISNYTFKQTQSGIYINIHAKS